jgi:putative two-component system response regulator
MNKKARVLTVDDEEQVLNLIKNVLSDYDYEIFLAKDGPEALEMVKEVSPDVILLDIQMPGMNGIEVTKALKENNETKIIPIVILSGLHDVDYRIEALEAGADDFLSKPPIIQELITRVKTLVKVKKYNDHMINYQKELQEEVEKKTKQIKDTALESVYRLSRAAEFRDEETGDHIKRLSRFAASLYRKLGKTESEVEAIMYASPMHDIGKIGVPDNILLKPGKLDAKEWELMKLHTTIGGKILEGSSSKFLLFGESIALNHHEKWDGSGYPKGLRGNKIPLAGRVTTVVDVFDALTSKRPYRKDPFAVGEAFDIIRKGKGTHFDPDIVDTFLSMRNEIIKIKSEYENGGKSWLSQISH